MADRNTGRSGAKKKEKKAESKPLEEKDKDKTKEKEKAAKKPEKPAKKPEKGPKEPAPKAEGGEEEEEEKKKKAGDGGAAAGAEAKDGEDFQPIELPPFEIVSGKQMSPFYFKFQFRNVEYSSGRNKTLLCYRVDTPGGAAEPLMGYMEDEHTTAHAEEAFFQQVLPKNNGAQGYDITWYVSSSPCAACVAHVASVLRQRQAQVRLTVLCSRLFQWEEPEIVEGLRTLAAAGCKLRMMKPADFQHVWETYVEKEDDSFVPWEDCQDNYNYYTERLAGILK
ncbi:unnamed protein product [Merluccius merluccius]